MAWEIGVDWNDDGFIAFDALTTDSLNTLSDVYADVLDYSTIDSTAKGAATVIDEITASDYGSGDFKVTCTAATGDGVYLYFDGASYLFPIVSGRDYTFVAWLKGGAGFSGVPLTFAIEGDVTGVLDTTALNTTLDYVQATASFTAGGNEDARLAIYKNADATVGDFYIAGLMIVESLSAPTGYNTGASADLYDNITDDTLECSFFVGTQYDELVAKENDASIVLDNASRDYSAENTLSPLYGSLLPLRKVQVRLDGTAKYTGFIEFVNAEPFLFGERTAEITTTSYKVFLDADEATTIPVYEGQTPSYIIEDLLTAFDSTIVTTSIDSSTNIIAYYGDNSQRETRIDLYKVIAELTEYEAGRFYFGEAGQPVFRTRNWKQNPAVSWTIDGTAEGVSYSPVGDKMVNFVSVKCYPRVEGVTAGADLWSLDSDVRVRAGHKTHFKAQYTTDSANPIGAKDVVTPAGADYVITGGSPTLNFTAGGEYADIEIDNTAGATDAILSVLNIKGREISSSNVLEMTAQDDASIAQYLKRSLQLDLKAQDDPEDAYNRAVWELAQRVQLIGTVASVTVRNELDSTASISQEDVAIGDKINFIDAQTGHDQDYIVVGYEHILTPYEHETTIHLELAPVFFFFILDVSRLNGTERIGY